MVRKHSLAIGLLNKCGYTSLVDNQICDRNELCENINQIGDELTAIHSDVNIMFKKKYEKAGELFKDKLRYINSLLTIMYGVSIKPLNGERDVENKRYAVNNKHTCWLQPNTNGPYIKYGWRDQ